MTGIIALIGGNEFLPNCEPMDRALFHALAESPRIAILPTAAANENPRRAAKNGERYFRDLRASVRAAMITDEATANDPVLTDSLTAFNMIYMTGGSPPYLLETLRDSRALKVMQNVLSHGGMLVGSSAAAMAMGAQCWGFAEGWLTGWGLVPDVAVVPHHRTAAARWDMDRMREGLLPGVTMLGLDEATAAYGGANSVWQVAGPGKVTVYGKGRPQTYFSGQSFRLAK